MPFPNHPEKYRSDPVVTPERSREYAVSVEDGDDRAAPDAVVLCYSRDLMEHFADAYDGTTVERYLGDLYLFADAGYEVGVLGDFGVGAPVTAMLMEELIADGVETFLSVGFAGSLTDEVGPGELVVCEKAIRDEGTSHHYVEPATYARPSERLTASVTEALRDRDERVHVGPSWTTDAVYRETAAEVERYASEGVLTVEMEAATVFAVARHRGVDAAAAFAVSDSLGTDEWDPKFEAVREDLRRLGDAAKRALTGR